MIYIPDRIIAKNPHSLSDVLRKVTEVLETGRDYSIIMLYGTPLKRHFSDIVSASATKKKYDVTLIDPFKLIDWKYRTSPDHLYPRFKLYLEQFKKGQPVNTPKVTHQHYDNIMHQETSALDLNTKDQRLHKARNTISPTGVDALL